MNAGSLAFASAALGLLLAGCQQSENTTGAAATAKVKDSATPSSGKDDPAAAANEAGSGVKLTPEEREKTGIATMPAAAAQYRPEEIGFGVVQDHQPIAQSVAEAQTAQTNAFFSKQSLDRARQLKGTPGAVSADLEQAAAQKDAVDAAASGIARDKLSSVWGPNSPWKDDIHDPRVVALAHGATLLVRVSLPLSRLTDIPNQLHAGILGAPRTQATLTLSPVWVGPADVNMPGPSLFATVPRGSVVEGEHIPVWVPNGPPITGVLVPLQALVLSGGKFWCYVEKAPGSFERVAVQQSYPVSGGYVVTAGVNAADAVVTAGAAHLLARESGSADESD